MTALLEVRALHGGHGRVEVLRGIDLDVKPGEIVALLGYLSGNGLRSAVAGGFIAARTAQHQIEGSR